MSTINKFVNEVIKLALDMELDLGCVDFYGDSDCVIMPSSDDIYEHIMGYDITQEAEENAAIDLDEYEWRPIERKIKQAIAKNMPKFEAMAEAILGIYH